MPWRWWALSTRLWIKRIITHYLNPLPLTQSPLTQVSFLPLPTCKYTCYYYYWVNNGGHWLQHRNQQLSYHETQYSKLFVALITLSKANILALPGLHLGARFSALCRLKLPGSEVTSHKPAKSCITSPRMLSHTIFWLALGRKTKSLIDSNYMARWA